MRQKFHVNVWVYVCMVGRYNMSHECSAYCFVSGTQHSTYICTSSPTHGSSFFLFFFLCVIKCPCLVFTPCDSMKLILQQKFYWFRSTKQQKHQTLVTERGEVRHTLALSGSMEPSMSLSFLMSLRVLGPGAGLLNPWELRRSLKSSFLRGWRTPSVVRELVVFIKGVFIMHANAEREANGY